MTQELVEDPRTSASRSDAVARPAKFNITALEPRILRSATAIETPTVEQPVEGATPADPNHAVDPHPGYETHMGSADADDIHGTAGADWMHGLDGNDQLFGDLGNDVLDGGAGDDLLHGGAGADQLHGGLGEDTASYEGSDAGVTVHLDLGTASGGHAEGDTFHDVEHVIGSDHNDVLYGDAGDNHLTGLAGNDTLHGGDGNDLLHGGAGADVLDGGAGHDIASYTGSTSGVTVNLATGIGAGGHAAGDKLVDIEGLHGSDYADKLIGDDHHNELVGNGGNDTLVGGAGDDHISGGAGTDIAQYSGKASDYEITHHREDGTFTIHDLRGVDGTDTVDSVEYFQFTDGKIAADHYVNHAPTDLTIVGNKIAENSLDDALVGHVSVKDVDAGDTHTFKLLDDAGGRFTIDEMTGDIHVAHGAVLDYESARSHVLDVQVSDAGGLTYHEKFTIAVTNVNEAPTDLTLSANLVSENAKVGTVVGTAKAIDPDSGEKFTYSLTDNADGRFSIDATTGQIKVADGTKLDYEHDTSHGVTVEVKDSAGHTYAEAFTIGVKNVNEKPTDIDFTGGTVKENSVGGTVVAKATGADPDAGDKLTYSLANSAGGKFAINAQTGEITVAKNAKLDFETGPTQTVTVRVKDAGGLYYDESIKIQLEDVNEKPTDLTITGGTVNENATDGTVVGQLAVKDPDHGDTHTYSLVNDAGGRFTVDANTGELRVADGSKLNFESATSHSVTVRVTDAGGLSYDEAFKIGVKNVNEAPTDMTLTGTSVNENAAVGTAVGKITTKDPDKGDTFTYSLKDDAGGNFVIDAKTGQISVAQGAKLDYEAATSHNVTVHVTDAGGLSYDEGFKISVKNVNEAPTDLTLTGNSVNENAVKGTVVGKVAAKDPDSGDKFTYSLKDDAGGAFTIDAKTGQIKVADGTKLDYESAKEQSVTVKVADAKGLTYEEAFTINVKNVNEAPTDLTLSHDSVHENATAGTVVGKVAGSDPDAGDTLTYSLVNNAGGKFTIDAKTGEIAVAKGANLDYESDADHTVVVQVKDAGGKTYRETFDIHLEDVNEAVIARDDLTSGLEDHQIVTGNVLANDYDLDGDAVSISGHTQAAHGTVSYNGDGTFTYTPQKDFSGQDSFTYTVTDGKGMTSEATVQVHVAGVADAAHLGVHDATLYAGSSVKLDISAALADLDGSEALTVRIENVPLGATLSAGHSDGHGVWTLTAAELNDLHISLPQDSASEVSLKVTLIATEADGDQVEVTSDLNLHVSGFQLDHELGAQEAAFVGGEVVAAKEEASVALDAVEFTDAGFGGGATAQALPGLGVDPAAAEAVFAELPHAGGGVHAEWTPTQPEFGAHHHTHHGNDNAAHANAHDDAQTSENHGHAISTHDAAHADAGPATFLGQMGDRFSWLWSMFWAYGGTRAGAPDVEQRQSAR